MLDNNWHQISIMRNGFSEDYGIYYLYIDGIYIRNATIDNRMWVNDVFLVLFPRVYFCGVTYFMLMIGLLWYIGGLLEDYFIID